MKNNENILEGLEIPSFYGDSKMVRDLIKTPFYENRNNYFYNSNWCLVRLWNDFFLEEDNFEIISSLMRLNQENFFLATTTGQANKYVYHEIRSLKEIQDIRHYLEKNVYYTLIWKFIGSNGKWACISEYDNDSLFIGYDKKFSNQLKNLIISNINFDKYIIE